MVKLYGSYNSRYFAVRLPGEVRLFQGVPAALLWSRPVDDSVVEELVKVGDNGEVFFQSSRGIFRLRRDRHATLEPINELCALARGDQDPVRLGAVRVNVDGREFCYERIQPESRLTDKIFRLLGSGSKGEPTVKAHQLVLHTLGSDKHLAFFSALIDSKRASHMQWAISPSFRYMVAAQPEKKGLHFQVIDIRDEAVTNEFTLPIPEISGVWINDDGTLMVDIRQVGMEKLVIARNHNGRLEKYEIDPPPGYRVHFLGPDYVALKVTGGSPRLVVRHFDNSVLANAEVRPLIDMRVEFEFNFNQRGNIDFLWWKDNTFQVRHTDVRSISTDARRWDLTAQQVHHEQEQALIQEATYQHQEERRRIESAEISRQLHASMQPEYGHPQPPGMQPDYGHQGPPPQWPPRPAPPMVGPVVGPEPGFPRPQPEPHYQAPPTTHLTPPSAPTSHPPVGAHAYGPPSQQSYAPPPPPPPPVAPPQAPRPPAPPPRPPAPPAYDKGFLKTPAGPPMTEPDPGFLRAPGPPPDTEGPRPPMTEPMAQPPAPPVAPPVPAAPKRIDPGFLRMGPPPSTEGGPPGPPMTEPQAPAPPRLPPPSTEGPPAPAVPTAPESDGAVAGLTAAEIDNELEKLRMHYIAGEIGRDDYYKRRSELEAARKQAVVRAAATSGGPMRLELDMESLGAAPAPPPPPSGERRRIDLSNSLALDDTE